MTVEASDGPRWGKVDPHSAGLALGITIPVAVILGALVLFLGWMNAPGDRKEVLGRGNAAPIWNSRPATARFQAEPVDAGIAMAPRS